MRTNWVREKLRAGQATIGCFLGLGSPNVAELMAHLGFDWLVIETEHSPLDSAQVEHMLMAMSGTNTIPLVRVPSSDPVFIQRALDNGAMGVVVPLVKTAAEVEAIVRATRYPPVGTRGFGPLRASHYALDYPDYFTRANDNMIVALILETKEAVEHLDEIAAVPGLDAVFLGLWDLCLSMGLNPLKMPFPETDAAIQRALEVGRKTGLGVGVGAATPEELRRRQQEGFTFLSCVPDYYLLAGAARANLAAFQR
jgi:2-keto-3-deoxy-L-rhamnonate aldolase RhmA